MENNANPVGGQPFFATPEALAARVAEYFAQCRPQAQIDSNDKPVVDKDGNPVYVQNPPLITGLAYFLGFADRKSLNDYDNRSPEFSYIIMRAKLFVSMHHERQLTISKSVQGSIFFLTNHGWDNTQVLEHKGGVIQVPPKQNQKEWEDAGS